MTARTDSQSLFLVVLLAVFAVLVALVLKPFRTYLLAVLLLAVVLTPLQERLAPRIGERAAAFVLVCVAVVGTAAPVVLLVQTLPTDGARLSETAQRLFTEQRIERRLEGLLGVDVPVGSILSGAPEEVASLLVGDVSTIVSGAIHAFLGVVLLLFLLYYLLKDGDKLVAWLGEMTPLADDVQRELVESTHETTWAVLKGHVFVAVVQGVVAGIGLLVVGLPHVVFWTAVMMVAELFPIVGVAAVLGPAALYLALTNQLLEAGFLLAYGLTAVAAVDDYLRAVVVDRGSALHSATVLVGVFGGVYVFGVMGLFYGPIVIGVFKELVSLFNERHARA
jgi:predicted PurR-regulated permease PerM